MGLAIDYLTLGSYGNHDVFVGRECFVSRDPNLESELIVIYVSTFFGSIVIQSAIEICQGF